MVIIGMFLPLPVSPRPQDNSNPENDDNAENPNSEAEAGEDKPLSTTLEEVYFVI